MGQRAGVVPFLDDIRVYFAGLCIRLRGKGSNAKDKKGAGSYEKSGRNFTGGR